MRRNLKLIRWGAVAALLMLLLWAALETSSLEAAQKVLTVGKDCKTIQECIDKASPGDTISVPAGTYSESLKITKDKDLKLIGEGKEKVVVKGNIEVSVKAKATIAKLTVSESPTSGIFIRDEAVVEITESVIKESKGSLSDGISVSGAAKVTVSNSEIKSNGGNGIWIAGTAKATISKSTISDNGSDGIAIIASAVVEITESVIKKHLVTGISVLGLAKATISKSTVSGGKGYGIFVGGDSRANIEGNTITDNDWYGIHADRPENIEICRGNTLSGNKRGDYSGAAGKCT